MHQPIIAVLFGFVLFCPAAHAGDQDPPQTSEPQVFQIRSVGIGTGVQSTSQTSKVDTEGLKADTVGSSTFAGFGPSFDFKQLKVQPESKVTVIRRLDFSAGVQRGTQTFKSTSELTSSWPCYRQSDDTLLCGLGGDGLGTPPDVIQTLNQSYSYKNSVQGTKVQGQGTLGYTLKIGQRRCGPQVGANGGISGERAPSTFASTNLGARGSVEGGVACVTGNVVAIVSATAGAGETFQSLNQTTTSHGVKADVATKNWRVVGAVESFKDTFGTEQFFFNPTGDEGTRFSASVTRKIGKHFSVDGGVGYDRALINVPSYGYGSGTTTSSGARAAVRTSFAF